MREIKFRGLRTDGRGWIYGSIVYPDKLIRGVWMIPEVNMCDFYPDLEDGEKIESHEHQGIIIGRFIEVMPESIGQYTGLKDKNGVEIYEGDKNQDKGVVIWNSDDCSFNWLYNSGDFFPFEDERKWCFITGNIHQP